MIICQYFAVSLGCYYRPILSTNWAVISWTNHLKVFIHKHRGPFYSRGWIQHFVTWRLCLCRSGFVHGGPHLSEEEKPPQVQLQCGAKHTQKCC